MFSVHSISPVHVDLFVYFFFYSLVDFNIVCCMKGVGQNVESDLLFGACCPRPTMPAAVVRDHEINDTKKRLSEVSMREKERESSSKQLIIAAWWPVVTTPSTFGNLFTAPLRPRIKFRPSPASNRKLSKNLKLWLLILTKRVTLPTTNEKKNNPKLHQHENRAKLSFSNVGHMHRTRPECTNTGEKKNAYEKHMKTHTD